MYCCIMILVANIALASTNMKYNSRKTLADTMKTFHIFNFPVKISKQLFDIIFTFVSQSNQHKLLRRRFTIRIPSISGMAQSFSSLTSLERMNKSLIGPSRRVQEPNRTEQKLNRTNKSENAVFGTVKYFSQG